MNKEEKLWNYYNRVETCDIIGAEVQGISSIDLHKSTQGVRHGVEFKQTA